jgi:adenine-specific DNA-methyltransferase
MEDDDDGEFATQVRGSYFYKQSQVSVKYLRDLLNAKAFNNPKDFVELSKLFDYVTSSDTSAIVLDFFAGSGSSGHAVMAQNAADSGNRRYILVQLPEPLDPKTRTRRQPPLSATRSASRARLRRSPRTPAPRCEKIRDDNRCSRATSASASSSSIRVTSRMGSARAGFGQTLRTRPEPEAGPERGRHLLSCLKLGIDLSTPIEERNIPGTRCTPSA